MSSPVHNSSKFSSSSSHLTPKPLFKFHHFPNYYPKNHYKATSKFTCSLKPTQNPNEDSTFLSILRYIPDWADEIKENGMKKTRTLYDHESWIQHRSSSRHVRHLLTSLSSRVILSLVPPVIVFTSVAVIIASYNTAVSMDLLPEFFPILRASTLPYQLTAPALALLLVFRTEASYSRFEEGKKAWTKIIAGTNDLARQVIASVKNPNDAMLKNAILKYIMAFPVSLKCHIIYGSDIEGDLHNIIDSDDLPVILSSNHRPQCIIEFISQSLQLVHMDSTKRQILESKLSCFHEGICICEQLVGVPIPLSYTRLTSRFLVLWHLTLPIILWDDCHWIVVPATFISAASLFCIEEVGVLIEEPFPMLALDDLCRKVRNNILDIMRNEKLIQARVNTKRKSGYNKNSPNGWPTSLEDIEPVK